MAVEFCNLHLYIFVEKFLNKMSVGNLFFKLVIQSVHIYIIYKRWLFESMLMGG